MKFHIREDFVLFVRIMIVTTPGKRKIGGISR